MSIPISDIRYMVVGDLLQKTLILVIALAQLRIRFLLFFSFQKLPRMEK